jgi:hypothetical protein
MPTSACPGGAWSTANTDEKPARVVRAHGLSIPMEGELQTLDGLSFLPGKLRRENVELLNRGRLSK